MVERQVDGLLVMGAGDDHRYLLPEIRRGTPAVFLDRPPGGIEADSVALDDRGAARAGVAALLAAGHRRVAVVGGTGGAITVAARLAGWRDAVRASRPDEAALVRLDVRDAAAAEAAARGLLAEPDPPAALFALRGSYATGVLRAAAPAGAAVLVFDRLTLADLLPVPTWTIDYDAADLGRRGAELLLDRLDGNAGPARRVVVPTVVRSRAAVLDVH
jgi:LacI family transcriptional regulator